ncbi:MAG: YitT family protein [Spirochaetia bacterium]|nr:YitT family protein [Spirochaetia bacterium]
MYKVAVRRQVEEYLLITAGSIITALGLVLFLTPAKIAAGGVSGLAVIIFHLTGFDPGYAIILLSLPIFFVGIKIFGRQYGLKSLYGTIALSAAVTLLGAVTGYEGLLDYSDKTDLLLSALFGGVIVGSGLGIVMKGGSNTGGTDILAQILHHYSSLPLGTSLFIVDGTVIAAAAAVFSIEAALFAVITVFSTGQVINLITSGANYAKLAYIISDRYDEIRDMLLNDIGLGGTQVDASGMYTHDKKRLIMTVVRNRRISQVTNIVKSVDPNAFMIITNASEVLGEGFMPIESVGKKF